MNWSKIASYVEPAASTASITLATSPYSAMLVPIAPSANSIWKLMSGSSKMLIADWSDGVGAWSSSVWANAVAPRPRAGTPRSAPAPSAPEAPSSVRREMWGPLIAARLPTGNPRLADPAGYDPDALSLLLSSSVVRSVIPAGAGDLIQPIHIAKVVEGPVPDGTEFEVEVSCENPHGPTIDETLTFPAEGGLETVGGGGSSVDCTVTETVTGGATTVAYECEEIEQVTCGADGQSFTFTSDVAEVQVTVTNTFAEPAPPARGRAAGRVAHVHRVAGARHVRAVLPTTSHE